MKKILACILMWLLTLSVGVLPGEAATLSLSDEIAALQVSSTPLEDFAALESQTQESLINYFATNGVPASMVREYTLKYPSSRLRYSGTTDLMTLTVQFLGCVSVAGTDRCVVAKGDADTASSQAQSIYPGPGLSDGIGDAFRHCLWSALMTYDFGGYYATLIGNKHEELSPNLPNARAMDLANNNTGRQLGVWVISHNDAKVQCKTYADAGLLVTLF